MIQARQALGRERIVREHSAIHAAIVRGDADTAIRQALEHLAGALGALTEPHGTAT